MERLMLLDGFGLVYRGYYALPPLTTSKGELVNGVFGFCSIVLRGFADLKPDYVAVAFDLAGPTFRHEQYAEYKATRSRMPDDLASQFPKVREVVKALRIPVYEQQGFEADDVIGALTRQAEAKGVETTIVTVDLDMLQLVTDQTRLMTTRSGVENTVIYDPARIWERYGLRPDQMIDYKALKGDPTDNIPGVPGVGEKTAAKLIAEWGTLDNLYARIADVKPDKLREKLIEHREAVYRGQDLTTIVRDMPDITLDLDAARLADYDRETVIRLFREYEFRTLIERLPAMSGESAVEKVQALRDVVAGGTVGAARVGTDRPAGWGSGRPIRAGSLGGEGLQLSLDFDTVSQGSRAEDGAGGDAAIDGARPDGAVSAPERFDDLATALAATINNPSLIGVVDAADLAGIEGWLAEQTVVGASIVSDDPRPRRGSALAFAVAGRDGRVVVGFGSEAADGLRHMVESRNIPIVAHEAKPILVPRFAADPSATVAPVDFDTQIAAYVLNAALRSQSIADVVAERLDLVLPPPKELPPVIRAGLEALSALAVRDPLARSLQEEGLERLFREIELPLIPVLARMEADGVGVDLEALAVLDREFGAEISRLEEEIYAAVGHQFTIGSPKQLGEILFEELRLPKGRKTKTGYSTDATVLEELTGVHPVVQPILDWRIYTKLRSTYVEALPTLIADDGRLHTTFHQAVAATGRLSSSDPNLQNIPIRTPLGRRIRRAFVAGSPDTVLVAADYSQIELRIIAHVADDVHLKAAFERKADIHRETAATVLHKAARGDHRGRAVDGQDGQLRARVRDERLRAVVPRRDQPAGGAGLHQRLLRGVLGHQLLHAPHQGDRAPAGLRHDAAGPEAVDPGAPCRNGALRGAGERMAINMPIQGTAADIVKIAMIRLADRLRTDGFRARMLLQVHDELLLEVPRDEVDRLVPVLRETMEGALPLSVPLTVDVKVGTDWESMTPVSRVEPATLVEAEA